MWLLPISAWSVVVSRNGQSFKTIDNNSELVMGYHNGSFARWATLTPANSAMVEELNRERPLCKMCHKNPAEYSGYCGDCYRRLETDEKTKKVTKHRLWFFSFFDRFSR